MSKISKICVIGSGVMGSGIAAQIANSETNVLLLDVVPGASSIAKEKMQLGKIPQIAHPSLLKYVEAGDLSNSLEKIKECDWIIEVIIEKLEAKKELYTKIAPYMKANAVLTSNTSTMQMVDLIKGAPDHKRFFLTHFFNPPRQMKLLELIANDETDKESINQISSFITHKLGKTIVKSNDTPGFIANRIGCFLLELVLKEAYEKKLSIVGVDEYFTKEMGLPSTGIFGLFDLIGLDIMQMISNVLIADLPPNDDFCQIYQKYDWYDKMLSDGYKGRKGLGGFYRMRETKEGKIKEVLDFSSMEYIEAKKDHSKIDMDNVIQRFYSYVKSLLGVVSSSKEDIDTAIKLGYSWKRGPFQMMGEDNNKPIDAKSWSIIMQNPSATLFRHPNGALIFSLATKMNVLDANAFNLIIGSVEHAEKHGATKLIIYNKGRNFSAGADLKLFLEMGKKSDIKSANKLLELGQKAMLKLKYSKVPVIACAQGFALGGGCEILLHSHKIFAHLDLTAGLVEVGVGLIPGWGGIKEMITRGLENNNQIIKGLRNIFLQNKSGSAYYFKEDYMIDGIEVVMNEDDLLDAALACDLTEATSSQNKESQESSDMLHKSHHIDLISSCFDLKLDDHSLFILKALQDEINSSSLLEKDILKIERRLFVKLLTMPKTLQKIQKII